MTTESKSKFAKRISRAPSYITELISHGRLVLSEDGKKIEVEASLARLEETASLQRQGVAAFHAAQRKKKQPEVVDQPVVEEKPKRGRKPKVTLEVEERNRQFYERILQAAKNNIKQLDFDMEYGRRFELVGVRKEAHSLGNTMRAAMERFVDTVAPRLAVISDADQRKKIIAHEVLQLRRVMKQEFPRAFRRLRKD